MKPMKKTNYLKDFFLFWYFRRRPSSVTDNMTWDMTDMSHRAECQALSLLCLKSLRGVKHDHTVCTGWTWRQYPRVIHSNPYNFLVMEDSTLIVPDST